MKKIVVLAVALFATNAMALIAGGKHDLTVGGSNAPGACAFCHMPHNSNTAVSGAPLWARTVRTAYTLYTSSTGTPSAAAIGANSQLCLSCHDGTAGLGTLHNGTVYTTTAALTTNTNIGTVLTNDHPVSIKYDPTATAGAGGVVNPAGLATLATAKTNGFMFFGAVNDQLECGSCHDPHVSTTTKFLRPITGTDFCAACHSAK